MQDYINTLSTEFQKSGNLTIAAQQKAYMRGKFEYYGMKTPERRLAQKPFLVKTYLPEKKDITKLITLLWEKPQRDYHLFAQELLFKYTSTFQKEDCELLEYMVTHNSWWDTIDFIATKLIVAYFIKFPEQRDPITAKWIASGNIWLQRCCLLYQLKAKDQMDTQFLASTINQLLGSKDFFINKAIGWVLREYSRTNPKWVIDFVAKTELQPLSKKEALRLL